MLTKFNSVRRVLFHNLHWFCENVYLLRPLTAVHIKLKLACYRHQAREAEPRDYDMSKGDKRDLCLATYKRIGDVTRGEIPETTYQDMAAQVCFLECNRCNIQWLVL